VTTGIVVSGILFSADQELGVEELAVSTSSDLVDGRRVQIDEEGTRNVFAAACLGEECLEGATIEDILSIGIGATIRSEAVLEKVPTNHSYVSLQGRLYHIHRGGVHTYSSQALLPSWVPAWPR